MAEFFLFQLLFVGNFHGFSLCTHKFDKSSIIFLFENQLILFSCWVVAFDWFEWCRSIWRTFQNAKSKMPWMEMPSRRYNHLYWSTYIPHLKQNKSNYVFLAFYQMRMNQPRILQMMYHWTVWMAHKLFIEMQRPHPFIET